MPTDKEQRIEITTFKSKVSTTPVEYMNLDEMLVRIKSDLWKEKILKVRGDLKHKDWLPCFTPTGRFSHRSINGMDYYNGVMCLDVDSVNDPEGLKEIAKELPYVHAMFTTPSGKGLKVIILTNSDKHSYTENEEKVAALWLRATGVPRDNHCKDIARVQYISWDPNLYYNPDSKMLDMKML